MTATLDYIKEYISVMEELLAEMAPDDLADFIQTISPDVRTAHGNSHRCCRINHLFRNGPANSPDLTRFHSAIRPECRAGRTAFPPNRAPLRFLQNPPFFLPSR